MSGLVIVVGLVLLAALTSRYGTDSRDGRDWSDGFGRSGPCSRRAATPASDLRAALAWTSRTTGRIRGRSRTPVGAAEPAENCRGPRLDSPG